MAKKRKEVSPAQAKTLSPRKTRSSTRKLAGGSLAPVPKAEPALKKAKVGKGKEKAKTGAAAEVVKVSEVTPAGVDAAPAVSGKVIIIEACKQCQSFNRTAMKVKDGLEKQISDVTVLINPDKPRLGCFEVRASGGDIFVSLLEMKRPFKPMKELNLVDVVSGIVEKLK